MIIRKALAGAGVIVGLYLTSAIQNGPEQVDANICKLIRRVIAGVPEQCISDSYDRFGVFVGITLIVVCAIILLWDFRQVAGAVSLHLLGKATAGLGKIGSLRLALVGLGLAAVIIGWLIYRGPRMVTVAGPAPSPTVVYNAPTEEDIQKVAEARVKAAQDQVAASNRERDELTRQLETLRSTPQRPAAAPPTAEYLKSARIIPYGDERLPSLVGEAAKTFDKLRIVVDYINGSDQRRVVIGALDQAINATTQRIPLITKKARGFQWGGSDDGELLPNQISTSATATSRGFGRLLGRVAIIGPDAGEQYAYFDIIRVVGQGSGDELLTISISNDLARFWPAQK
jgi:hypothetical protein